MAFVLDTVTLYKYLSSSLLTVHLSTYSDSSYFYAT